MLLQSSCLHSGLNHVIKTMSFRKKEAGKQKPENGTEKGVSGSGAQRRFCKMPFSLLALVLCLFMVSGSLRAQIPAPAEENKKDVEQIKRDVDALQNAVNQVGRLDPATGKITTAGNLEVPPGLRHLLAHVVENRFVEDIRSYDREGLSIYAGDVLNKIQSGDASWEKMVPPSIAGVIKQKILFGWKNA